MSGKLDEARKIINEVDAEMAKLFTLNITASGGVSSVEDVKKLTSMGLYGAILGKALYTGDLDLKEALKVAEGEVTA